MRREDVLIAAAIEFSTRGYAATSFATIAQRAGSSRGHIQHYIKSKPELAAELAWRPFHNGGFLSDRSSLVGGVQMIRQLVDHVAHTYIDDVFARASLRLMDERGLIPAELPVPFQGWIGPIAGLLREGIADGDIDPATDVDDLAWRCVSSFAGTRLMAEVLGVLDTLPDRAQRTVSDLLIAHRPASSNGATGSGTA